MIFNCITDSIAWSILDESTYHMLFNVDEMVAALFRNFLLAQVCFVCVLGNVPSA